MVLALMAVLFAGYVGVWLTGRDGAILLEVDEPTRVLHKAKIIVRKLPVSDSFFAVPLYLFPDDSPRYRVECYQFGSPILYSAHTYQGASFIARTAQVEWDAAREATVYLDSIPVLKCDSQGYWMPVR